jgi:hypothetical protein
MHDGGDEHEGDGDRIDGGLPNFSPAPIGRDG